MTTTLIPKRKLRGDHVDYNVRIPKSDFDRLKAFSEQNGWSPAEFIRQSIRDFLARNMDITDDLYPSKDDE